MIDGTNSHLKQRMTEWSNPEGDHVKFTSESGKSTTYTTDASGTTTKTKGGKTKEISQRKRDRQVARKSSAFTKKPIKYDEDKGMEYVMHKGKKVYGSWNEFEPNRNNKVKTRGLSDHLIEKDGELFVNEATWDSTLSHNK